MRTRILLFIWIAFVIRGLFYVSYLPIWEGFDEWAHYANIQIVAQGHPLPDRNSGVSREIQESLKLVPWVDGPVNHDRYWRLDESERKDREESLRSMPMAWQGEPVEDAARAYESQQAPLYYWLIAPFY